jgi:hypothetical protein
MTVYKVLNPIWQLLVMYAARKFKNKISKPEIRLTLRSTFYQNSIAVCTTTFKDGNRCRHICLSSQMFTHQSTHIQQENVISTATEGKMITILIKRKNNESEPGNAIEIYNPLPERPDNLKACLNWEAINLSRSIIREARKNEWINDMEESIG